MKKTVLRKRWEAGKLGRIKDMTEEEQTITFEMGAWEYCLQGDQDCDTCSLVDYGRDCRDTPL